MTASVITPARPAKSLTEGYALCTPGGTLLGHTYRQTAQEAIAALDAAGWASRQAEGWTVEHVYARIFTPVYFVDFIPQAKEA